MAGFASAHSPTLQHAASPPVPFFLHTNRRVRRPPSQRNFVLHSGWWADTHDMKPFEKGSRTSRFRRDEYPYHARFAAHQAFKYQWMLKLTADTSRRWPEPWFLMDTDTVVQCSADEMRQRFLAFDTELVVGAEFQWWPKRDKLHNPWPPASPSTGIRYPNSGMLAGSRRGYDQLEKSFQRMPRYPCCARQHNGSAMPHGKCHIDDQHCLQAALLLDGATLDYALDLNASLFLNLNGVSKQHLVRDARTGRCVYTPSGLAPCVFHSNGRAAKPLMARVFECMPSDAWVVPDGANRSAAALFKVTH